MIKSLVALITSGVFAFILTLKIVDCCPFTAKLATFDIVELAYMPILSDQYHVKT